MSTINPGGVIANPKKFILVDVRTPEEYHAYHVDGAILIPLDHLEHQLNIIPQGKPVVCICRSGNRSETATYMFRSRGFEARNLNGGMLAWVKTEYDKGIITEREYKERIKKINGW